MANSIAPGGSAADLAGDITGSLGAGAIIVHSKLASSTTATATFTLFTLRGALHGTARYTFSTSGPVGSAGVTDLKGTGKITSGTETYKGATGTFTVSGISPAGQVYYELSFRGSMIIPIKR